jgi:hypothetical protein
MPNIVGKSMSKQFLSYVAGVRRVWNSLNIPAISGIYPSER